MATELTVEQIAALTPEQITEIEEKEAAEARAQDGETESGDEPEQEEEAGAANGAGETDEEDNEPVVLTKSGKGTIPYEQFKGLRVENATLREQIQALEAGQAELAELREQRAKAATPAKRDAIQEKLKQRISTMKEDFPDIGESLESVSALIDDMSEELREQKKEASARIEEQKRAAEAEKATKERTINEQVQDAKENNPDLSHWEQLAGDEWQEALMQDQVLLQNPKWANKPIEERFIEVVKRVRAIMPNAAEPNETPSAKTQAKAAAKVEKAPTRKPTTLSDIQGSANPSSEKDQLENLSPHELTKRLMKMPAGAAAAMRADLD
ncbi:MAG: hypothetical protein ABI216_22085 [Devosia sp.]